MPESPDNPLPHAASVSLAAAGRALCERLRAMKRHATRWQRLEAPVQGVSPLEWLNAQARCSRYYWRSRNGQFEMAGLDEADIVTSDAMETSIHAAFEAMGGAFRQRDGRLRYYGGVRFHPLLRHEHNWHDFKAWRFVMPLLELCRNGDVYTLACNVHPEKPLDPMLQLLGTLNDTITDAPSPVPRFSSRVDLPDRAGWHDGVNRALETIDQGGLEKVVLARQSTFHANAGIDPMRLLHALTEAAQPVFHFCFQPAPHRAFLGASPEMLYARAGRTLRSEALAGTRPRGGADAEDERLARELAACDKEAREHRIVVEDIRAVMAPLCETIDPAPPPSVVKLARCQHLLTPIAAELRESVSDAEILARLHPTPAVGGRPRADALAWIREQEPFERGVYAAPVGWVSSEAAEFCVAIRSALVRDRTLAVYAGAGIVRGSDPEEEWRELNAKMAAFLDAMNVEN